ncbi:GAF domain-containing protein [Halorarum halophilum]|uniref:histidine kinase n=1 Tax=Halorarum halophilum TaxID=2743090 RepID=A0A7D5KMN5_9EURY|nr:GAF domain-containing protein [Halobaculum halophilum]QLG28515.1 GAF domain-containing protein [Halobaculum halophilum]
MTRSLSLFVVGDGAAAVVSGLAATDDGSAATVTEATLVDRVASEQPDAVVLVGDADLDETAVHDLDTAGIPIVALGEEPPPYAEGFVPTNESPAQLLLREVRLALDGETRLQLRESRRRVTRLHDGAADVAAARSFDELYDRAADVAADVLSFDHCWLGTREADRLVPRFQLGDVELMADGIGVDEGIAGETIRGGESVFVREVSERPEVSNPRDFRSFVSVPVGDFGVYQAASLTPHGFDEADLELAELFATHVSQAHQRIRAESDLQDRQRKVTGLHRAAPRLVDADTEAELFDLTVEIAETVLEFDRSYLLVALPDGEGFETVATTDPEAPERAPESGILGRTFAEGRTFHVDEVAAHPDARPHHEGPQSAISVPFGDDAVFQVIAEREGAFDDTDRELAELLVSHASATRERVRSEAALRESRRTIERLHGAAADIAKAETERAVLDRAIAAAEGVLSFDRCTIALLDETGEYLVPAAEPDDADPDASRPMHVSEGVTGRTYRTGESVLIEEVAENEHAAPAKPEYRSGISVPVGDLGTCQAVSTEPGAFDDTDLELAELLMAHVAVALERVRAEGDLRDERDRLSALFENIPDAAVSFEMVDGEPIARAVNTAFEETFGYPGDDLIGESVDEFIVPADTDTEADELNRRLRAGENVRRECRRLTAHGVRDFLMYVVPLELHAANVRGYAIYSDISERKERERALERQNERLEEFASVVSHDLRNPLSVAEGYLELARETGSDEHLETVENALERMRGLIDDLLMLAREGRVVGETEPVDLAEVADVAWRHVDTGTATLSVDEDCTIDADPDRLGELLENLFRNSIEHGGSGVAVRIECTDTGFVVEDDGNGIPAPDREEVFEPGVTSTEDGTGFGLAIVRRVAEAHDWSVELVEGESGGARFEFRT